MPEILATSIITVVITAIIGYLVAIPKIRRQLEADLKKESESIRQQLRADQQKEYDSRFNERKWETYNQFADIVRRLMENVGSKQAERKQAERKQAERKQEKIIRELYSFVGKLWVVGGDNVIEAFNHWRRSESDTDTLIRLMQIIIEMRKDLGYQSSMMTPEDLLRTFINNFDDAITQKQEDRSK